MNAEQERALGLKPEVPEKIRAYCRGSYDCSNGTNGCVFFALPRGDLEGIKDYIKATRAGCPHSTEWVVEHLVFKGGDQ